MSVISFPFFDRIRRLAASLSALVAQQPREYELIVQKWSQFEPGWGRTHGGYSLHLTEADRLRFVAKSEEEDRSRSTYFVPDSTPVVSLVDRATYKKVKASHNGIWWPSDSLPADWHLKRIGSNLVE